MRVCPLRDTGTLTFFLATRNIAALLYLTLSHLCTSIPQSQSNRAKGTQNEVSEAELKALYPHLKVILSSMFFPWQKADYYSDGMMICYPGLRDEQVTDKSPFLDMPGNVSRKDKYLIGRVDKKNKRISRHQCVASSTVSPVGQNERKAKLPQIPFKTRDLTTQPTLALSSDHSCFCLGFQGLEWRYKAQRSAKFNLFY